MELTNIYLIPAVAGVVELYKRLVNKDYKTAGLIAVAAASGAILAPLVPDANLGWYVGMLYGFSASGVITTVSYFRS